MYRQLLQYGLDIDGRLRYVDDVPNGKKCGCRCPNPTCNKPLIAKHDGKKKKHHFAHDSDADCPGARMSALHLIAQRIIAEEKQIMHPSYEGEFVKKSAELVLFDKVTLEVNIDENGVNRKIDCVGTKLINGKEHTLWIEIRVTHEVDDAKKQDIQSLQQACIEINLLDMLDTDYTEEDVRERLLNHKDDREWICCPKLDQEENEEKEKDIAQKRAIRKQREEESRKYREQIKKIQQSHIDLISEWQISCNSKLTSCIIAKIKENPYNQKEGSVSICTSLLPNQDLEEFIKKYPLNRYGLEVFYTLLNYFKNNLLKYHIHTKDMLSWGYHKSNVTEAAIAIEEIVSMHIVATIWDYKLIQNYIKQSHLRNTILNILSFYYHRILASDVNSHQQLADKLIQSNPELMWCLQAFVEYDNKKNSNPHILLNSDTFRQIKEIADTNDKSLNSAIPKIFLTTYKHVFSPNLVRILADSDATLVAQETPSSVFTIQQDYIEPYHEMSYAEETEGWKQLNEKYKNA